VGAGVVVVCDRRAVARAHAFDFAGKHRAAVEACADDFVGLAVGMRNPARHLARVHRRVAAHRHHGYRRVARLLFQHGKINRAPVDARRRAGFQAALRQLQLFQNYQV